MNVKKVHALYFSPNHTTRKTAMAVAEGTGLEVAVLDFTHVYEAPKPSAFSPEDLVILALPVYAGRIPFPALDYLAALEGRGAPCILLGVYGNRAFDDFLVELEDVAREQGLRPVAAAAFIGEHCITNKLGTGRPNADDLALARRFGADVMAKLAAAADVPELPLGMVPGKRPYQTYAASKSGKLNPVKVANGPTVDDTCIDCKQCVAACPIGLIHADNVRDIDPFECLRCHACVHTCPVGAISFQKPQFRRHIQDLEEKYTAPRTPTIVL